MGPTTRRIAIALCLYTSACSSSGRDEDDGDPNPGSGGGRSIAPPPAGGGTPEPGCEPFEAAQRSPFSACGGEPFGLWRISAQRWETDSITVEGPSLTIGGPKQMQWCPANVLEASMPKLVLELLDGGVGRMYQGPALRRFEFSESCGSVFGKFCDQRKNASTGEKLCSQSCGRCQCRYPGLTHDNEIEWQRVGSQLMIVDASQGAQTFDYCVSGDELQLSEDDGPVFTLARAFAIANPVRCGDRTGESCELGNGCRLGACVGEPVACRGARRLEDCENRQGCSWDAALCTGEVETCNLRDFGSVPGCELVASEPRCAGTRTPCPELDADACSPAWGCALMPGCTGDAVNCSALSGACDLCANVEGCSDCAAGGPGTCTGMSTCLAQTTETACGLVESYRMGRCTWVESVCRGSSLPCEQLDVDVCADAPGCAIEFSDD